jgi:GNAT superfamily N-acetyltransferase
MTAAAMPLRDAGDADHGFILDCWYRSFESDYFDRARRKLREALGKRKNASRVILATDPEDTNILLGFAVVEGARLHYVYVRQAMRRLGVARQLLESVPIETYSTPTDMFHRRIRPAERGWKAAEDTL